MTEMVGGWSPPAQLSQMWRLSNHEKIIIPACEMVRCGDWSVAWAGEAAGHQTADWRLAHLSTPGRHQALASSSMDTVDTDTGDTVDTSRPGQVAPSFKSQTLTPGQSVIRTNRNQVHVVWMVPTTITEVQIVLSGSDAGLTGYPLLRSSSLHVQGDVHSM